MKKSAGTRIQIQEFLQIENDPKLFEFKFPEYDFHLWPIIRFYLLQRCIEERLNVKDPWAVPERHSFFDLSKYVLYSIFNIPLWPPSRFPIMIFGSDISNIFKDKSYFNRLNEYFALEYDKETMVIESSDRHSYHRPKKRKTYYLDGIKIMVFLLSKFRFLGRKNLRLINDFIAFLKCYFGDVFQKNNRTWDQVAAELRQFKKRLPFLAYFFKKILKYFKARVILVETACSGSNLSVLVKVAKENGIRVAEYQHGLLSSTIPYYSFSAGIKDSPYMKYLPDDFLYYGDYWTKITNIPANKTVVGNPYLTEYINTAGKKKNVKNVILYVSGGSTAQRNIDDVLFLLGCFGDNEYRVVFRPHPCEYPTVNSVYSDLISKDVVIYMGDLYRILSVSKYLIGESSTVLFEALAFGVNIFVLDTPLSRSHVDFPAFRIVKNMSDFILKMDNAPACIDVNGVWRSNWKLHYHKYIDGFL